MAEASSGAGAGRRRRRTSSARIRSTTRRRCSGVVPQQPPTTSTPKSRTNSASASASASGESRISAGPVEQLRPITSTGSRSSVASAAPTSVPRSMRPLASMSVGWAMMATSRSASRR